MIRTARTLRILLILTTFLSVTGKLTAQDDVYLEIYAKTFQRMQIDLYGFQAHDNAPDADKRAMVIQDVLKNDLWMSGYFSITLRDSAASNGLAGNPIANLGGLFRSDQGKITIQPHLIDNVSGHTILRSDYSGREEDIRAILHKISDDIVFSLTGEQGIARSKVAYVIQLADGSKEIAVMDYDGLNSRVLTSDKSINISPAWSPDGSRLCYTSFKNDNPDLFVYNLKTSTQVKVSSISGLNSAPSWSPDGNKIALTLTQDGNAEIYILDIEKRNLRRITYNGGIDSSPSWAPSNREMAFTSDRSGSPQVYIMDSDGLNVRRLTFEGSYNDSPAWSPRGDRIAYVSRTESGFDIYAIDVTGENRMRLTDSSGANENPKWSPNGYALIFSSNRDGRRGLYSMFWDGTDQKKLTIGPISYSPAWSLR
jgi:TolB protein